MKRFTKITCALVTSLFLGVNLTSGYCFAEEVSAVHQKIHDELLNDPETSQTFSNLDSSNENEIIVEKNISSEDNGFKVLNVLKKVLKIPLKLTSIVVKVWCYFWGSIAGVVTAICLSRKSILKYMYDYDNMAEEEKRDFDKNFDAFYRSRASRGDYGRFGNTSQQNWPTDSDFEWLSGEWESWKQSFDNADHETDWEETYQRILSINSQITAETVDDIVVDSVSEINGMMSKCQTYKQSFASGNTQQLDNIRVILGQIIRKKNRAGQ